MKLLLLCGSIAQKSHTRALLNYLEEMLQENQVETIFWDLGEKPVPTAIPEYHHDPLQNPDPTVQEFVKAVASADALILGTPLYHGSYAGILKTALDNLKGDALRGKWIGLAGNVGSERADMVAFSHLRHVVNTLVGYTLQTQVKTAASDYDESGTEFTVTSSAIHDRCQRLIDELLAATPSEK
jgi:azobenzene reductase